MHKTCTTALLCALALCNSINATKHILVSIAKQKLTLFDDNQIVRSYTISTSGTGIGDVPDSNCTPLGKHTICAKIGKDQPRGMIFKSGIATQRIAKIEHGFIAPQHQADLITTRILQLNGIEPCNVHSRSRGIWIHGTPYEGTMGTRCSHGCVRMRNADIVELFDLVDNNTIVNIVL